MLGRSRVELFPLKIIAKMGEINSTQKIGISPGLKRSVDMAEVDKGEFYFNFESSHGLDII